VAILKANFENYRLRVKVLCGWSAWELDCSRLDIQLPEFCRHGEADAADGV